MQVLEQEVTSEPARPGLEGLGIGIGIVHHRVDSAAIGAVRSLHTGRDFVVVAGHVHVVVVVVDSAEDLSVSIHVLGLAVVPSR